MAENKNTSSEKKWTPITISIIALAVSCFTLWFNFLSPFDPEIDLGTISFIPDRKSKIDNFVTSQLGISISLYNNGAKSGFIEDLSITMINKENRNIKYVFFPYMYYDSKKLLISRVEKKPDAYFLQGDFAGFYLLPKEVEYHEILFNMKYNSKLEPGVYEIAIYGKIKNEDFIKYDSINQKITDITLQSIGKKEINTFHPYFWRKSFVNKIITDN